MYPAKKFPLPPPHPFLYLQAPIVVHWSREGVRISGSDKKSSKSPNDKYLGFASFFFYFSFSFSFFYFCCYYLSFLFLCLSFFVNFLSAWIAFFLLLKRNLLEKKIPSILTLDDHMMFTQLIEFRASFQYAVILLFLLLSIGRSLCFKSTFREIVVKIKFALTSDS